MFLADPNGANAVQIAVAAQGTQPFFSKNQHTHNPAWSPDGDWIYFVHGTGPPGRMDVWRVRPSGESPQQLTDQHADVNFLAPLDSRTVLFLARAEDWSGPWLWALDVESKVARRVTVGLEKYTSVSASQNGRRVVATVAKPTASLWRVPLREGLVEDSDANHTLCQPNGRWRRASLGRRCSISRSRPAGPVTGSGGFRTIRRSK